VIDTERFGPARFTTSLRKLSPSPIGWERAGVRESPLTLLAVGRLVKQKRLDRFLSVLNRLRKDYNLNVRGWIVGPSRQDDGLRQQLEELARQLGLFPDGVQFL